MLRVNEQLTLQDRCKLNNINDLSLRELKLIADIPRMRSIRSFATDREITPQALSKSIKKLELTFGFEFLQRSSIGVTPTNEVVQLSIWAREIIEKVDRYSLNTERRKNLSAKITLTLGTRSFLNTLLSGTILSQSILSDLSWRFIDLSPHETIEAARRGGIQVAITLGKINLGEKWKSEKIGILNWSLYVRKDHPLPAHPSKEDLELYPFTFATYWDGTTVVKGEDFIPLQSKFKNFGHGMQTAQTAIEIAKNSDHIVNVPKLLAKQFVDRSELRELKISGLSSFAHEVYLSVQIDEVQSPLQKKLISSLSMHFKT